MRLRHPNKKVLRSVKVNGADWLDFDAAKEWVRIQNPAAERYAVAARYWENRSPTSLGLGSRRFPLQINTCLSSGWCVIGRAPPHVARVRSRSTTELSDAGGPARPNWQPTWPARIRSSDFVSRFHGAQSPG